MKLKTIRGGFAVAVSNEEEHLIERIEEDGSLDRTSLDEREKEVARKLTSRGVLVRFSSGNKIKYRFNGLEDVWRD